MNFDGKVILVTGASSGIGADAACYLAKLGGKVVLVGRNIDRLNSVAEKIIKSGAPIPLTIAADITEDAEHIIDETIDHFGKLDVLINSAGMVVPAGVTKLNMQTYDRTMDTNVRSVVVLVQLAIPHLEKTKGNIVNVSSIAGLLPSPSTLASAMSKAALDQFTKSIAVELGPKGIRVNSINPSMIKTPIFDQYPPERIQPIMEMYQNQYPLRRIGEVSDTSAAIAFLASDLASFQTGNLLPVDGGAFVAGVL